jgi:TolA-binding protein
VKTQGLPGWALAAVLLGGSAALSGCGVFALQRDHESLAGQFAAQDKAQKDEIARLNAEIVASRDRLDNALKANADTGSDLMSEKSRMNDLAGRLDEANHKIEELQSSMAASRTELDARFDQLARAQAVQPTPAPPPVHIPENKADHYAAIEAATKAKDYALVRTLGHEYLNRYATDEKADSALYLTGRADLDDNRPSSALGEFNRFLKLFPHSKLLDKTLFAMGMAYEALHDCANAKLAYGTVVTHFPREKIGTDARARVTAISAMPPGSCAPP